MNSASSTETTKCNCLLQIFSGIYVDGEEYWKRVRKTIVLIMGAAALISLMWTPYYIVVAVSGESKPTQAQIGSIVVSILMALPFVGAIYARVTRSTPEWILHFMLISHLLGVAVNTISQPLVPVRIHAGLHMMIGLMLRVNPVAPYIGGATVLMGISSYNSAYLQDPNAPLLLLEGAQTHLSSREILFNEVVDGVLPLLFIAAAGYGLVRERLISVSEAEANVELSQKFAFLLQQYDTDGMHLALDQSRETGEVNKILLETFYGIQLQLELWRPFLPNWLLLTDVSNAQAQQSQNRGISPPPTGRRVGAQDSLRSPQDNPLVLREDSLSDLSVQDDLAVESIGSEYGLPVPSDSTAETKGILNRRVAMVVLNYRYLNSVDRDFSPLPQNVGKDGSNNVPTNPLLTATKEFVDLVQQLASQLHGAVHHTIADTIIISWGAASSFTQPEVKAVSFLAKLKTAISAAATIKNFIVVSGGAAVGPAMVALHYTELVKQQTLTIHLPWKAALFGLAEAARRHSELATQRVVDVPTTVFFIDQSIHETSKYCLESRLVDQLRFDESCDQFRSFTLQPTSTSSQMSQPSSTGAKNKSRRGTSEAGQGSNGSGLNGSFRSTTSAGTNLPSLHIKVDAYEVVQERSEVAGEWLYSFHGQDARSIDDFVTEAATALFKGDYEAANTTLATALNRISGNGRRASSRRSSEVPLPQRIASDAETFSPSSPLMQLKKAIDYFHQEGFLTSTEELW